MNDPRVVAILTKLSDSNNGLTNDEIEAEMTKLQNILGSLGYAPKMARIPIDENTDAEVDKFIKKVVSEK